MLDGPIFGETRDWGALLANPNGSTPEAPPVSSSYFIMQTDEHHFVAVLCGAIGAAAQYVALISLLYTMKAEDELRIMIDSPGGSLMDAICLSTAISSCAGKVTMVGLGQVQSAGSFLFAFGPNHEVEDGAMFMYHGATLGLYEKVGTMQDIAAGIGGYTGYLAQRSIELGLLTEEELTAIKEKQTSVFLTGRTIRERLAATATATTDTNPPPTNPPAEEEINAE